MPDSNAIVNGWGAVTDVESPPMRFVVTSVVMEGAAQGVVMLSYPGEQITISAEILQCLKEGDVYIVRARMDAGSLPETFNGEVLSVHAKENEIGFLTTDAAGNTQYWSGQNEDGTPQLHPVSSGSLHVQDV